jgi:excisionase family DNA binding protein
MTTVSTEQDLPETRPVLCVQEAAQLLGISPWLLLQEIKRNRIPHKRVGRRLVFSRQRLLDWLASDES